MTKLCDLGRASEETTGLFYSSVQLESNKVQPVPGGPKYRSKDTGPDEYPVEGDC